MQLLRIDDYPTGIRPIQPGQLDMFDRMLAELPPFYLGVVPATYILANHSFYLPNAIICQHGVEHGYTEKSKLLTNDPYNIGTVGVFDEFEGIGQKKASMATNILVRDFGIDVKDKKGIDVSFDIHIRRIFLRTGLVNRDDRDLMVRTARRLNPEYPGSLDLACWQIGRTWCHPSNPLCPKCPIRGTCPKLTHRKLSPY